MFRRVRPLLLRAVLGLLALVFVATELISPVRADASSGWLSQADPGITNVTQLPSNQSPGISNRDCTQENYLAIDSSTGAGVNKSACFVHSTTGTMGVSG